MLDVCFLIVPKGTEEGEQRQRRVVKDDISHVLLDKNNQHGVVTVSPTLHHFACLAPGSTGCGEWRKVEGDTRFSLV